MTATLHLLQPTARLWGRFRSGLAPWRWDRTPSLAIPWLKGLKFWSEDWQALEKRLESIESDLRALKTVVLRGGDYDRWDLEVRGGLFGSLRICMAIEDHGSGTQLIRFRSWPRFARLRLPIFMLVTLITMSALDQAWAMSIVLGFLAFGLVINALLDWAAALTNFMIVLKRSGYKEV